MQTVGWKGKNIQEYKWDNTIITPKNINIHWWMYLKAVKEILIFDIYETI